MTLNDAARSFADFPSPTTERMARPWPLVWTVAPIGFGGPALFDDLIGPNGERARVFALEYPSIASGDVPSVALASHDDPDLVFDVPLTDVCREWARAS